MIGWKKSMAVMTLVLVSANAGANILMQTLRNGAKVVTRSSDEAADLVGAQATQLLLARTVRGSSVFDGFEIVARHVDPAKEIDNMILVRSPQTEGAAFDVLLVAKGSKVTGRSSNCSWRCRRR